LLAFGSSIDATLRNCAPIATLQKRLSVVVELNKAAGITYIVQKAHAG
jgi:hypothetical protein